MKRIRSGDKVIVIAGRSKGHIGVVLKVMTGTKRSRAGRGKKTFGDLVIVEGANLVKKHVKPNPQANREAAIVSIESPLDVSNVALYNEQIQKADKVGFKFIEKDGVNHKVRYFKSTNELVDIVK